MVEQLGIDGQSSDESDGETCNVKLKIWCSREVQKLLECINSNCNTQTILGNHRPGNQPHCHTQSRFAAQSIWGAVSGLPRNFYNDIWYQSLRHSERDDLLETPAIELLNID